MNNSTKTIPILLKELKDVQLNLKEAYKQLGNKLLKDAADPVSQTNEVSKEELIQWQKLYDERSLCTGSILDIKNNNTRLSELDNFKKQLSESITLNKKKFEKLKGDFLVELYNNYEVNCSKLFHTGIGEVHEESAIIDELQNKIEELKSEKQKAGFLSRIGISHKISLQESKIKNSNKKIKAVLIKYAGNIEESEEIKNLYDSGIFLDDIKTKYDELLNLYKTSNDFESRLKMIDEEKTFLTQKLTDIGAEKNSKKQIEHLTNRIKKLDEEIDEVLEFSASKYANSFYSPEGVLALGENPSNEELGKYADYLKKIGKYRKQISKTKYNIEFCETLQKIKTEENKIQNLNRIIKTSENLIKETEKKISDSESAIKTAESKITDLEDYAQNLKNKFSDKIDEAVTEE